MLLIIDPNNDFADSHGSLYVPHADKALKSIAHYIEENNPEGIAISQDTHRRYHVGHCAYWQGAHAVARTLPDRFVGMGIPRRFGTSRECLGQLTPRPTPTTRLPKGRVCRRRDVLYLLVRKRTHAQRTRKASSRPASAIRRGSCMRLCKGLLRGRIGERHAQRPTF